MSEGAGAFRLLKEGQQPSRALAPGKIIFAKNVERNKG
jgi:hypothetical protein